MPSISVSEDEWAESARSHRSSTVVDGHCYPPPLPAMITGSPLYHSDRRLNQQHQQHHQQHQHQQILPAAASHSQPFSSTPFAEQHSAAPSAFLPYTVQHFHHKAAPHTLSVATVTSPSSSPLSASTASTASSSSSNSPQLHPLPLPPHATNYPFSAFAVPPPSVLLPPSHNLHLRPPTRHVQAKRDEDATPPVSPNPAPPSSSYSSQHLLLLHTMNHLDTTAADVVDDDMTDHSASTPVTSLIAAARAFATAPPNPHLGAAHFHHHQNSSSAHRISKACEACRRRKRKCDGALPQCVSCIKVGSSCHYPQQTRRRGPQAGMVQALRAQVNALESELHKERSRNSSVAAVNIAEHCNIGVLLARDGEQKARTYINTYFDLLNSTLFPFLVQSHFEESWQRHASSPTTAPPVWHLTVGAVLAQGAGVSGDMAYSEEAAVIARAAAAPLLDQPSADVIRGLLLLSYHCLSCNQLSRVSCFLAVATRMCAIVDMSPEVPLLCRWLEDALCAIRTWWRGLRTMPEGSYQKEQRERFPADWARYERLSAYLKVNKQLPSATLLPAHSRPSDSSASGNLSLTGPPDRCDLDDSNIRWEVLSTLGGMTEARGEYNENTHLSVYHHLCVLTKAQHSRLTTGAVSTTIAFLTSQALFFVNEISSAVEFARVCTRNLLSHDASHCAFLSLVAHFLCQVPQDGRLRSPRHRTVDDAELCKQVEVRRGAAQEYRGGHTATDRTGGSAQ